MSNQARISARQIKKYFTSMVVLLIFLFPVVVSARWMVGIANLRDTRSVFSDKTLQSVAGACKQKTNEVRPFAEPLVTVTFDDGWESVYSQGLLILEKYCTKSTQYILGDHFEDRNYMSKKQILSLKQNGHEIASHTMTHPNLTILSDSTLDWELKESKDLLSSRFGEVSDLASPLGAYDDRVLSVARKYYRSHRNTAADPRTVDHRDVNTREYFDKYQVIAYTVRQETTLEDIQKLLDYTIEHNGWLVLNYHQVDDSGQHYAVSPTILEEHLQLIHRHKVRTPVFGEVFKAIELKGQRGE